MTKTVLPIAVTSTDVTQWANTWYTGNPAYAIDQNPITKWTYNGLGSIRFDLGSSLVIDKLTFSFDGSVSNGNYAEIYIDNVLVAEGIQPAGPKIWDIPDTVGQFVTYKTVAKPHNEYLQIATWSELAEFSAQTLSQDQVTDVTAPTISSIYPADGATSVQVGTNFVLKFSEEIEAGSGSFVLKSGSTTIGSIDVADSSQVSVNGYEVTINPHYVLSPGVNYTVISPAGIVTDLAGNGWVGTSNYDFVTDSKTPDVTVIYGGPGYDIILSTSDNERIDGREGLDTVIFSDVLSQYQINAQTGLVTDQQPNRNGADSLANVERLKFSDLNLALDTAKGEKAGSAYRLYKAAFDRAPDEGGLGFWIDTLDGGTSLTDAAQGFINSAEFKAMYGENATDQHFVTLLYNHVLHRAPEGEGYQFWLNSLASGASRAQVLKDFSESAENITQTAELVANGIQYQEWVG